MRRRGRTQTGRSYRWALSLGTGLACISLVTAGATSIGAPASLAADTAAKPTCPPTQFGATVSVSGGTAVIGSPNGENGSAGAACIYTRSGTGWRLQTVLRDPHPGPDDFFGNQVATSSSSAGTYVMVGTLGVANKNPELADGPVYVYVKSGNSWRLTQTLKDPTGIHEQDCFGCEMAMSGTSAVFSATGTDRGRGAVYVFALANHTWRLQAKLGNPGIPDFGGLVGISGATVVVGDGGASSPPGVASRVAHRREATAAYPDAYVYVRSKSWHLQAHIAVHSTDNSEEAVAISGSTILLGGIYVEGFGTTNANDEKGHVYVMDRAKGVWRLAQVLKDSSRTGDGFSIGLAIAGGITAVGAPYSGCGVVYFYKWSRTQWASLGKLTPGPGKCSASEGYGWSISVSGTTALIGAPGIDRAYVVSVP